MLHMLTFSGEDKLMGSRTKEDYYREAAQHLNAGERAVSDSGEGLGGTLAFLTRGTYPRRLPTIIFDLLQAFNNWLPVPWMMHCGRLRVFLQKDRRM